MASVQSVIARMEGMVGSLPTSTLAYQPINTWVECCKLVMRSTGHRDATDWEFAVFDDPDESADVIEAGGTLYGVLFEQASSDASADVFVLTDDADGSLTVSASDTVTATAATMTFMPPAATTDGTPEYHGHVYCNGISFTNSMMVGADGLDGTNPATGDLRIFALYRTTAGLL